MSSNQRTTRNLGAVLALCLVIVAALALGAAVARGGDDDGVGLSDDAQIMQVIQAYRLARFPAVPASDVGKTALSLSTRSAMNEQYQAVLQEVATDEFTNGPKGQLDVAANLQSVCNADSMVLVEQETQVLALEDRGDTGDGDRKVWVRVWNGEASRAVEADGKLGPVIYVDDAPIYEYIVRLTQDGWKIVSERTAVVSNDADPKQYGPTTPHDDYLIRPEEDAPPKI